MRHFVEHVAGGVELAGLGVHVDEGVADVGVALEAGPEKKGVDGLAGEDEGKMSGRVESGGEGEFVEWEGSVVHFDKQVEGVGVETGAGGGDDEGVPGDGVVGVGGVEDVVCGREVGAFGVHGD